MIELIIRNHHAVQVVDLVLDNPCQQIVGVQGERLEANVARLHGDAARPPDAFDQAGKGQAAFRGGHLGFAFPGDPGIDEHLMESLTVRPRTLEDENLLQSPHLIGRHRTPRSFRKQALHAFD